MSGLTRFTISTPSRHPANLKGYDVDNHSYRADYVKPKFWELHFHYLPEGFRERSEGRITLPASIASYQWTVKQIGGTFSKKTLKHTSWVLNSIVQVPKPGEYEITLEVKLKNGKSETSTRKYHLRDFLIVGIGDSFASGQGNPDVPAMPSPDQKAMCKATTIKLILTKGMDELEKFGKAWWKQQKELLKIIPYAGKIALGAVNGVEDVADFVWDRVDDLKDWAVGVGRKVGAVIVEGVEEFVGLFGLGDGGESDETKPHPAAWQEPNAYRSYRSGQSLAAAQLETDTLYGADRVTFLGFGRTGSEINAGLLGPRTVSAGLFGKVGFPPLKIDAWTKNRGQIKEAKDTIGSRRIDALIITIGVNDLGFSSLVTDSILWKSGEKRNDRVRDTKEKIEKQFPVDFEKLRQAVETELNPRQVFITEYPIGIFKEIAEGAKPCGVLGSSFGFNLDGPDARDLGDLGKLLNKVIREKADEFGWILVDGIEKGFDGHGYCARRPYFVSAEESCLNQGDFEGMLHPNQKGHAVTRDCIAQALRRKLLAPEENWLEPVLHVMMN